MPFIGTLPAFSAFGAGFLWSAAWDPVRQDFGAQIEVATANDMFTSPSHPKTQEYITGRFG